MTFICSKPKEGILPATGSLPEIETVLKRELWFEICELTRNCRRLRYLAMNKQKDEIEATLAQGVVNYSKETCVLGNYR